MTTKAKLITILKTKTSSVIPQLKCNSLYNIPSQSSNAVFKKEGFAVGSKCIKKLSTGEALTYIIDPNDLEIGDFLGSGASGSVHLATYKPYNTVIAVKSINLYDKNTRKQFKNDLRVLSDNKCPNLIRFYGAFFSEGNVKILLEYMNLGSLDRVIEMIRTKKIEMPCIPEKILSKITHQIIQGLYYLHKSKHQIHRDIKPANILLNTDGIVKLTDFGIAKALESTADFSHTFVGSRNFMSPERISGKEYSYPSDIWSVGLVVYELATGKYPYGEGNDFLSQIAKIVDGPEPSLPSQVFSKEFVDFISICLKKDPSERASIQDLNNHPWITAYINEESHVPDWLAELFDYMIIDQDM